jgi:uncharacterized RDD family membrane protein YckC
VFSFLLSGTLGRWFAERAVVTLSIGSPDTFWRGPVPMVLGIFGTFVYVLPFSLLLVLLGEVFFGAGPGKWLLGLDVTAGDGSPAHAGRRFSRWTIKCSGPCGIALALALANGPLAISGVAATLVMLAGSCLAMGPRRLALHDRLSGTAVCSRGHA